MISQNRWWFFPFIWTGLSFIFVIETRSLLWIMNLVFIYTIYTSAILKVPRKCLILFSRLRLRVPKSLFFTGFTITILWAFPLPRILYALYTHSHSFDKVLQTVKIMKLPTSASHFPSFQSTIFSPTPWIMTSIKYVSNAANIQHLKLNVISNHQSLSYFS